MFLPTRSHEVLSARLAGEPVIEVAVVQRAMRPLAAVTQCTACRRQAARDVRIRRCTRCFRIGYCSRYVRALVTSSAVVFFPENI